MILGTLPDNSPLIQTSGLHEAIFEYLLAFGYNSSPLVGIGSLALVKAFTGAAAKDLGSVGGIGQWEAFAREIRDAGEIVYAA